MKNSFSRISWVHILCLGDYCSKMNLVSMLITSHQDDITTIRDFNHVLHVCHLSILKLNFRHKFLLWWESQLQPKCFHMTDQNHPQLKSLLKWKYPQQYYYICSICCNFTRNISYYSCNIIIIKICCNVSSTCYNFTNSIRYNNFIKTSRSGYDIIP